MLLVFPKFEFAVKSIKLGTFFYLLPGRCVNVNQQRYA